MGEREKMIGKEKMLSISIFSITRIVFQNAIPDRL